MPISIGETEIMGDDGNLSADFNPSILGDAYSETGVFKNSNNIVSIMKSLVDTKTDLGKKLENIIQIPGEDASDEQKSDYTAAIRKASGAAATTDDYEFGITVGGEAHDEYTKVFREKFLELGLPPSVAADIVALHDTTQEVIQEALQAQANEAFKVEVADYTKAHLGDKLVTGPRTAAKAIIEFADDGLRAKVLEAKLVENPGNFKAWKEIGITPKQLLIWENVGTKMKSDKAISDEGITQTSHLSEEQGKIAAQYSHPTSVKDRHDRGVAV